MENEMYKRMVLESPLPYARIKKKIIEGKEYYTFIEVNNAFGDILKTKKEDIENKLVTDFFEDEEIKRFPNNYNKINDDKYIIHKHLELDGSYYYVEIYINEECEYYVRLTKVENINNKLSSTLKKSPFISWLKDLNGKYIDVNEKFLEAFQVEYEDVIGKTDFDLFDKKSAEEFREQDKNVGESDRLIIHQEIMPIPNEPNRNFQTAKWPYRNNDKVIGIIGITIELTDKLKLQKIIEKTQENFLDMANNIDELIVIRDKKKALYVSPYFEELYGFKPDSLYEDMDNWYRYWDKVEFIEVPAEYECKDIDSGTFRVIKEGKIDKWIQYKFVPIFDDVGNVVRKIGLLKDITEKKKIDDELENLRIEFFSNLSHELRTPINMIMSALQLINFKLDEESKNNINKYLNIINQNSLRQLRLVNNLIDTTKIDSGSFSYNPQNKDIISYIENITDSVISFVEKNNMEIVFDTDVEEKIIAFDMNHIERIILNLISNAIKFNKPGGKIEVKISTEDEIEIAIKDSGIGVPKDKVDKIFERFEQVNKHSKREREGSGIGLSLVKSLVEINKGTIKVNSKLYEGSEFIITLPDLRVEEKDIKEVLSDSTMSQVNKMEVEFSDIY